jgi:hypothetical protein
MAKSGEAFPQKRLALPGQLAEISEPELLMSRVDKDAARQRFFASRCRGKRFE